jgi:hypothetical protein
MNRILGLIALACAVSPLSAHKTRVDFDHRDNFSRYKTYSWAPSPEPHGPDVVFPNQLMQQRIVSFVDAALAARHLTRVPSGGDLQINFEINIHAQPVFTTFTDGFGPGWGWGWDGSAISTTTTQVFWIGTLVVNLTDRQRHELVFQGVSSHTISSKPEHNTKRLAKAVNEIFEKYPPR